MKTHAALSGSRDGNSKHRLRIFVLLVPSLISWHLLLSQVSISPDGSGPDASAMLEVKSTDKGLLIPRLTEAQRTGILTPAAGLLVFQNNNTTGNYLYNGTAWKRLGTYSTPGLTQGSVLFVQGNDITANSGQLFWDMTNNRLGIGTSAPGQKLTVNGIIESTSGGFKFPDGSVQAKASKGCLITFGALSNDAGRYLRPFADASEADIAGSTIQTVYPLPVAGRIVAVSWQSETATSSSRYTIRHGSSYTQIAMTGQNGTLTGLSLTVNANDVLEVYHSSGTLAGRMIITLYLNE